MVQPSCFARLRQRFNNRAAEEERPDPGRRARTAVAGVNLSAREAGSTQPRGLDLIDAGSETELMDPVIGLP